MHLELPQQIKRGRVGDDEIGDKPSIAEQSYGILEFKKSNRKNELVKLQSKSKESERLKINYRSLEDSGFDRKQTKKYLIGIEAQGSKQKKHEQIFRSKKPWSSNQIFHYMELHIKQILSEEVTIWIGLSSIPRLNSFTSRFVIPGNDPDTIGLKMTAKSQKITVQQNGHLVFDSEQDKVFQRIKSLDIDDCIGLGYYPHKGTIFFTLNGQKFTPNVKLSPTTKTKDEQVEILEYYPTFAFKSKEKLIIDLIFENACEYCRFEYNEHVAYIEKKLVKKEILDETLPCILKETINPHAHIESQKYNLVRNYLKFYGFENSAQKMECEMKKRNMKFKSVNRPIKNRQKYDKRFEDQMKQFDKEAKEKKIRKDQKRKKKHQQRKNNLSPSKESSQENSPSSASNNQSSSESSNWSEEYGFETFMMRGDFLPEEMRKSRKKIEQPNYSKQKRKLEKKKQQQRQNKQLLFRSEKRIQKIKKNEERLFNKERIYVMRNLRLGKLDVSWKILEEHFPQIIETEPYLKIYFKALTFMKICCEENVNNGFEFLQEQKKHFQKFENCLFPFYKQNENGELTTDFRVIKQILLLLCPDFVQKFRIEKQFDIFGEFMGKLICEKMGYVAASDLEIVAEHFRNVKVKIQQMGIPVGNLKLL